ncbi:glycosyltransferase [Curvibacter sp. RS43]|uniref:glycosyltransferase family 2 protein n=1 Tax=Curvibacter microcysteis TaxID=3026419 RepID=UPI00235E9CA6|nr:glycosyltransferase [Curvibacter sp. RS43]MDD0811813.1 glycosyltransferase [Curvibacter sp. RS43]
MPQLYESLRRPYYIEAPPYRRSSAGIRVMHMLCHVLNRLGEEAYVFTSGVNPELNTPTLSEEVVRRHQQAGREPIVVYPEIVSGNPRRAKSVVRYVLNVPGLIGGDKTFADTELIYAYGQNILPPNAPPGNVLFFPSVDSSLFNNRDNPLDTQRQGILVYPGRHLNALKEHPELAQATVITATWPASRAELAALMRRSEMLYCFESTAIALEAVLCGCPAVTLHSPFFDGQAINSQELGREGMAFGGAPEEVAYARRTVGQMQATYQRLEEQFWVKLQQFIRDSQALPLTEPAPQPMRYQPGAADLAFAQWRQAQSLNEFTAQALAERMMVDWQHKPRFHLLLSCTPDEQDGVTALLASLDAQLYPEWILTVLSTADAPSAIATNPRLQWLCLREASAAPIVLQALAEASPADWLGLLPAGVTVAEPQSLQVLADQINAQPAWRLVYGDDALQPTGQSPEAHFKPDFNLDLLRSKAYTGRALFVEKQAWLACGGLGPHTDASAYDLVLRMHDQAGAAAIGHLSELLWLYASAASRHSEAEAERAALREHLARQGLAAEVLPGLSPHTHHVRYAAPQPSDVTALIAVRHDRQYLQPLLASWQQLGPDDRTPILLLDLGCEDPDELAFLDSLAQDAFWQGRVQRLDARGLSPAQALNLGLRHSTAEHLLCLDVRSHLIQPDWLERLLGIAQRPDVGAVAPRLVNPANSQLIESYWLGGLEGLAGPAFRDLALDAPGLHERALCEQSALAVNASVLLLKRSALAGAAWLDETLPERAAWAELGLRLRAQQRLLVWTPHAVVLQHPRLPAEPAPASAWHGGLPAWPTLPLQALAQDPNHHRQLSLSQPGLPETARHAHWVSPHAKRLRWLLVGPAVTGPLSVLQRLQDSLRGADTAQVSCFDIGTQPGPLADWLMDVLRAAPDRVLIHGLHLPLAQALLAALAQHRPNLPCVVLLDQPEKLNQPDNFLCPPHPALLRSRLRPLLAPAHTVLLSSASDAATLAGVHPRLQLLQADPLRFGRLQTDDWLN